MIYNDPDFEEVKQFGSIQPINEKLTIIRKTRFTDKAFKDISS